MFCGVTRLKSYGHASREGEAEVFAGLELSK
jgi:hypothetical protein